MGIDAAVLSVSWMSNCEKFLVRKNDKVDETCRVSHQKLVGTLQPCESFASESSIDRHFLKHLKRRSLCRIRLMVVHEMFSSVRVE